MTYRRNQLELIADLLKIMCKEDHATLKHIAECACMPYETARNPFRAIAQGKLALMTGQTPIDSAVITQRGLQYLSSFRDIQNLMRSGIPQHG